MGSDSHWKSLYFFLGKVHRFGGARLICYCAFELRLISANFLGKMVCFVCLVWENFCGSVTRKENVCNFMKVFF